MHEAPEGSGLQKCPCPFGMRIDVATLRQLTQIAVGIQNMNTNVFKVFALMQAATGLTVDLQRTPSGDITVNVSAINQNESGIVGASAIPNIGGGKIRGN